MAKSQDCLFLPPPRILTRGRFLILILGLLALTVNSMADVSFDGTTFTGSGTYDQAVNVTEILTVTPDSNATITFNNSIDATSGLNLNNGNVVFNGNTTIVGTLATFNNINNGSSLTINGNLTISGSGDSLYLARQTTSYLYINEGATLTASGAISINTNNNTQGIVNQLGGTVNFNTTKYFRIGHFPNSGWASQYNLIGGTLNVPNISTCVGYNASKGGELNILGGVADLKGVVLSEGSGKGILKLFGGELKIGSNGVSMPNGKTTPEVNLGQGTVTATASHTWSSNIPITLTGRSSEGINTEVSTLDTTGNNVPGGVTTFNADTGKTITIAGVISGVGALTKTGAGTLELSGANTYSGGTTISEGTLKLSGESATLGSGSVTINDNATLEISGAYAGLLSVPSLSGSGAIDVTGTGSSFLALANGNSQDYSGTITISSGSLFIGYNDSSTSATTLNLPNASVSITNPGSSLALTNDGSAATTFTIKTLNGVEGSYVRPGGVNYTGTTLYPTIIVGDGEFNGIIGKNSQFTNYDKINLIKNTAGTLTLSGANTYSGTTTISEGVLKLTGAGTLGTGAVTVGKNATLEIAYDNPNTSVNISSILMADGDVFNEGSAFKVPSGTVTFGTTDVALNNLSGGEFENGQITVPSSLTVAGKLTLNNDQMTKFIGSITAPVVEKTGLDTLQLCFDAENAVSINSLIVSSGRVDLKGYMQGGITVDANGIFSPGNSVGEAKFGGGYELKEGATLLIEQDETGIDTLTASSFGFGESSGGSIEFDFTSFAPSKEYDFIILTDGFGEGQDVPGYWESLYSGNLPEYYTTSVFTNAAGYGIVRLSSPSANEVPEPSTWALLLLGAAGLLYVRKRTRK